MHLYACWQIEGMVWVHISAQGQHTDPFILYFLVSDLTSVTRTQPVGGFGPNMFRLRYSETPVKGISSGVLVLLPL